MSLRSRSDTPKSSVAGSVLEDLLGYEFKDSEGLVWRVTGSPDWANGSYMYIEAHDVDGTIYKTVRATSLLMRHRELSELVPPHSVRTLEA